MKTYFIISFIFVFSRNTIYSQSDPCQKCKDALEKDIIKSSTTFEDRLSVLSTFNQTKYNDYKESVGLEAYTPVGILFGNWEKNKYSYDNIHSYLNSQHYTFYQNNFESHTTSSIALNAWSECIKSCKRDIYAALHTRGEDTFSVIFDYSNRKQNKCKFTFRFDNCYFNDIKKDRYVYTIKNNDVTGILKFKIKDKYKDAKVTVFNSINEESEVIVLSALPKQRVISIKILGPSVYNDGESIATFILPDDISNKNY